MPSEIDHITCEDAKEKALILYRNYFPNVSKVMQEIGYRRQVFYQWKDSDEGFRQRVKEVEDACLDQMEEVMHSNGMTDKKAVIERFFVLKAKRAELYGDKYEISNNTTLSLDFSPAIKQLSQAMKVGHAEVISEVTVGKDSEGTNK